jgi:hypothetical protein
LKFPPARRRDAVGIVAQEMVRANPGGPRIDSIERRLHRKLTKNETDKLVLSAASGS